MNRSSYGLFGQQTVEVNTVGTTLGFDGTKEDGIRNGTLNEMGTRLCSSWGAHWTPQDSAEGVMTDPASLNRYAFMERDPANLVDPHGLCSPPDYLFAGLDIAAGTFGVAAAVAATRVTRVVSLLVCGGLFFATTSGAGAYDALSQCAQGDRVAHD